MDFLEKIGYTDQGKRLRKRFSHYSEWVIQSQSLFEVFPFLVSPGAILEYEKRSSTRTMQTRVGGCCASTDRKDVLWGYEKKPS